MNDEAISNNKMKANRLIILTGPSCVGKTPLLKAFQNLHPQQASTLQKIVLYNSRSPRLAEKEGIDYYFRSIEEIEKFRNNDNFILMEIRGDLQALDSTELLKQLENSDLIYEGNTYISKILLQHNLLKNINKLSIFISPFSDDEILQFKSDLGEKGFENYVYNTMKSKLLRRAKKNEQELTDEVIKNINHRAEDAYYELKNAELFDFVIPNHDGEGSDNWEEPIPENSDAHFAINKFSNLLNNENSNSSENWKE